MTKNKKSPACFGKSLPDWIKSNAGWWAEGLVSDEEFVQGIQWLIEEGVMTV